MIKKLSEFAGITEQNPSFIKTGKFGGIRLATLNAICKVLQCQPGDILEYREEDASFLFDDVFLRSRQILLDLHFRCDKVHIMNNNDDLTICDIPVHQARQFRNLILRLFQCCQERMQHQCERFGLPDAEIRCLLLFGEERYLTAKGIALKLDVVKSRVTKIVEGLIRKKLIQKVQDPEDSRVVLLSLTPRGQVKLKEVNGFTLELHSRVLSQIHPDQRVGLLNYLELLRISMETINERLP